MKYLKPETHYQDLYDKFTIEHCRRVIEIHNRIDIKKLQQKNEKFSNEQLQNVSNLFLEMELHFKTGERYAKKADTIKDWINRDRAKDQLLENTNPPQLIRCESCASAMEFKDKHLWGSDDDQVLFFFQCPNNCLPHKFVYDDGRMWTASPQLCEACHKEVEKMEDTRINDIITTTYYCEHCDKTTTDELDLSPKKERVDPDFAKDKERFCLDDKAGHEYLEGRESLKRLKELTDKWEERDKNKELYDRVAKLNRLTIPLLKEHIAKALVGQLYSNLVFEKPDMARIVSISFSVDDVSNDSDREACQKLKKLLNKLLVDTNWRLMSEGINYRLGILSGRLRVYEKEEELVKLIK